MQLPGAVSYGRRSRLEGQGSYSGTLGKQTSSLTPEWVAVGFMGWLINIVDWVIVNKGLNATCYHVMDIAK